MFYKLDELAWPEAQELIPRCIALFPVGTLEQHGPHLTLDTDNMIAQAVSAEGAARTTAEVMLCPPVLHGYAMHNMDFPGTLTVGFETMAHYMADLAASLAHHGCLKIVYLNGHGSNTAPLEMAARLVMNRYPEVLVAVAWPYAMAAKALNQWRDACEDGGMAHACELETSVIMHLRPELVHLERAVKDINQPPSAFYFRDLTRGARGVSVPDLTRNISKTGAVGDPTVATAEKGAFYLNAMADALADFLAEFAKRRVERQVPFETPRPTGLLPW
ncbi:MAG: creatininase family protein [Actinobacteria bacterium]|nr:creatininase family protein [Actinomycetota bacterium]